MTELRGFLSLTEYYRKFVFNYAQVTQLLTQQLKKYTFGWMEKAKEIEAGNVCRSHFSNDEFNKIFVVETDATGFGG